MTHILVPQSIYGLHSLIFTCQVLNGDLELIVSLFTRGIFEFPLFICGIYDFVSLLPKGKCCDGLCFDFLIICVFFFFLLWELSVFIIHVRVPEWGPFAFKVSSVIPAKLPSFFSPEKTSKF